MKKFMLFTSALAGLFLAASCQQENLEPEQMSNTVKFTVEAPGALFTKAEIADGTNVNEVHYAVYKTNDDELHAIGNPNEQPLAQGVVEMQNKRASVEFDLLQDQDYTVIFWAQVAGKGHYTLGDLRTITVASNVLGNDETRAAFYAKYQFSTETHTDHTVTLCRPFAQLNLLTTPESLTPVQEGQSNGYTIDVKTSEVTVVGLSKTFSTVDGMAPVAEETLTFKMNATPEEQGQETLSVNGKAYHYVSMNYFFVPEEEKLVDIEYTVVTDKGNIAHEIVAVPVKENYRTNVIGNLLTKETTFEIIVDADFEEPAEVFEVVSVATADQLAEAIEAATIETNIRMEGDINLNELALTRATASEGKLAVKAGKEVLIDLNGYTLFGTSNVTGKNFEMIDVRGNLTIVNGTVTAEFLGADMGWGASTNVFNVTAGGVLTLKNVTAKNLGGSAMAFVAHLNNWGDATINVENSTLESTYIAVRAFNSGYDMNYVTIKNSTLKAKYCFWVHNYKKAGDSTGDDSTLALDIYNGTNTFEYTGKAPVLYGFNNPLYYNAEGCMYVSTLDAFKAAITAGTSVVLDADIDYGTTQLAVTAPIRIDLGGHTLTTANNYGGISLKGGPSIVNGTINHTGNTAAIKAWNVGTFENLTINVTPTEGKVKGGIVLQSGAESQVGAIKNVTITGATNGIETYNCGWTDETPAIVYMENVNIDATDTGILLSAHIAKAKDCQIKGENYGIKMHLKGQFRVEVDLENCVVEGETASIYAWDEKGISNTNNCSLTLTYDAATTLVGPFVWDFEEECQGVVTLNRPE